MYLDKKIPVAYTSFYNSISTEQAEISLRNLIKVQPDIILIYYDILIFDSVYPSLRINPIYRWMLLSENYNLIGNFQLSDIFYLMKSNHKVKYSADELKLLDKFLSNNVLYFLPEVWGNSTGTLPMYEVSPDFTYEIKQNKLVLTFKVPQRGRDIDLLYLEPSVKLKNKQIYYLMKINGSDSKLNFYSNKNGNLLIPIDNFPSWLLNNEITEITILSDKELSDEYNIKFYKRKYSDDLQSVL